MYDIPLTFPQPSGSDCESIYGISFSNPWWKCLHRYKLSGLIGVSRWLYHLQHIPRIMKTICALSCLLQLSGDQFHRDDWWIPHKGQRHRALMISLICAWTNGSVNNRDAGDLRRHGAHYDVTVMLSIFLRVASLTRFPKCQSSNHEEYGLMYHNVATAKHIEPEWRMYALAPNNACMPQ